MNKLSIVCFVFSFFLLFGCQSTEEKDSAPLKEVLIEKIYEDRINGDYLDAVWQCEKNRLIMPEFSLEFENIKNEVINDMFSLLGNPESEDPEKNLNMYLSLRNIGRDVSEFDEDKLINAFSDSLAEKNPKSGEWFQLFLALMKGAGTSPADEGEVSWKDIIDSTVTVYMDRGIKIESGYGFKDIILGSGFFISEDGYIITNYHVISSNVDPEYEGFSRVYIRLKDNKSPKIPVKVAGWDPLFDLALLKAEVDAPAVIPLAITEKLDVGQRIYAIGSPGGLEKTLTSGIVSSEERPLLELGNVIQVDVPINHGNSGGPLLDENGNLVGVVFAGVEDFEGINFAIPVDYLYSNLYKMAAGGESSYPFMGFITAETAQGLEIIYTFLNSPAESGGLKINDIIISVNDIPVKTIPDMFSLLSLFRTGTLVKIKVLRDEKEMSFILQAAERINDPLFHALDNDQIQNVLYPVFGMQLKLVDKNIMFKRFSVTRVLTGSPADESGISVDDSFKLYSYKYLEEQNAVILDISIRKKTKAYLDISMKIGTYLFSSGIF